jgi:hypothetical protein
VPNIPILEIYDDVVKDTTNADQNGQLSYAQFSRISRRAELLLLDWISGGVTNERLPIPYVSQKNKDWLSPFITKYQKQVVGGFIDKPSDYYQYDNFYRLGSKSDADCDDNNLPQDDCNTPIEILDGQQFYARCNTYIDELKVSADKPICKMIGNQFEVAPKDLGSVCLEYVRLPVFGSITGKNDPIYNEEVPDVVVDYEWEEWARPFLIWFITDIFSNTTREQALKQFNAASNPKQ